ncbi:uncharacterized protein C9orf43 homolog isoform X2 [Xyrauchen texanus]|uniref:uncharacterized protein C9orf43 homolog isoform X2 n=1 Tax=Xyrauchen texanus TaxID=154827 RepID=UPI002242B506|nr:uncharacterized protein C9orf43 homolog isoform X2 [Xyrauchen texanus]
MSFSDFKRSVARELDEAHCLSVLCCHTCCWNTEHRVAKGIPRHTPARVKRCSFIDEELPSLSIVNVSEWVGQSTTSTERPAYKADTEACLNDVSCVRLTKETKVTKKRADLSLPGSNLVFPITPTNKQNKIVKLNTVHISPLIGCSELPRNPVVMWIRNPHHVPQWLNQNKSKSLNVAIKELVCLPSFQVSKSSMVTGDEIIDWQAQRGPANLQRRYNLHKRRNWRGRSFTLEGAGTPQQAEDRWVGIGFNPIPKTTPHHLSCSLLSKDTKRGSLDQKPPGAPPQHAALRRALRSSFTGLHPLSIPLVPFIENEL